jgi:hypothetical protein
MNLVFFETYFSIFSSSVTHVPGSASDVLIKRRSGSVFIVPSAAGAAEETKRVDAATRAAMHDLRNMRNGREILQSLLKTELTDAEDQTLVVEIFST